MATIASAAVPPAWRIFSPAAVARGWAVTTISIVFSFNKARAMLAFEIRKRSRVVAGKNLSKTILQFKTCMGKQ
jgi:hypothetical protein